jgi:hypothetical protein
MDLQGVLAPRIADPHPQEPVRRVITPAAVTGTTPSVKIENFEITNGVVLGNVVTTGVSILATSMEDSTVQRDCMVVLPVRHDSLDTTKTLALNANVNKVDNRQTTVVTTVLNDVIARFASWTLTDDLNCDVAHVARDGFTDIAFTGVRVVLTIDQIDDKKMLSVAVSQNPPGAIPGIKVPGTIEILSAGKGRVPGSPTVTVTLPPIGAVPNAVTLAVNKLLAPPVAFLEAVGMRITVTKHVVDLKIRGKGGATRWEYVYSNVVGGAANAKIQACLNQVANSGPELEARHFAVVFQPLVNLIVWWAKGKQLKLPLSANLGGLVCDWLANVVFELV